MMHNIPGKTLILIGALITVTVGLLAIAIWVGGAKPQQILTNVSPTPAIEKTAQIAFTPSLVDLSLAASPTATVDIVATTGKNPITGAQVDVVYDPLMIKNVQLLPPDPATSLFGVPGSYTNLFTDTKTPGHLTYAVAINQTGSPITGTGSIGRISFSAVKGATPTATITFGKETAVTSRETQSSVLNTTTPLTVKLQ